MTVNPTKSDLSCLLSDEVRRFVLPCALCKPDYFCLLQLGLFDKRLPLCVNTV